MQRGDHRQARPAVPRVRHQTLHRAVRRHGLQRRTSTRRAVDDTRLFLEGRNDELVKTLRARMLSAADGERFEEAAQLRDAMRTVQTLHDRQQKMATTELGHRDVFGLKLGPAGVVIQVFQVRRGRVVERVELGTEAAIVGAGGGARCSRRRFSSSTRLRSAPPEVHVPAEPDDVEALESWLSERAGRRVQIARAAARREARVRRARQSQRGARRIRRGSTRRRPRSTTRSKTLQHVLALPALPRRIECFDISTIQGSETVASMVVCEDGRMRRGEYRKFRIRDVGLAAWGSASKSNAPTPSAGHVAAEPRAPSPEPRFRTTSRRCTRWCCAATASCSSRAVRFPI